MKEILGQKGKLMDFNTRNRRIKEDKCENNDII